MSKHENLSRLRDHLKEIGVNVEDMVISKPFGGLHMLLREDRGEYYPNPAAYGLTENDDIVPVIRVMVPEFNYDIPLKFEGVLVYQEISKSKVELQEAVA